MIWVEDLERFHALGLPEDVKSSILPLLRRERNVLFKVLARGQLLQGLAMLMETKSHMSVVFVSSEAKALEIQASLVLDAPERLIKRVRTRPYPVLETIGGVIIQLIPYNGKNSGCVCGVSGDSVFVLEE